MEVLKVYVLESLLPAVGHHMPRIVASVGGCPIVTWPEAIVCFKQFPPPHPTQLCGFLIRKNNTTQKAILTVRGKHNLFALMQPRAENEGNVSFNQQDLRSRGHQLLQHIVFHGICTELQQNCRICLSVFV
jgi:hypothetical protein